MWLFVVIHQSTEDLFILAALAIHIMPFSSSHAGPAGWMCITSTREVTRVTHRVMDARLDFKHCQVLWLQEWGETGEGMTKLCLREDWETNQYYFSWERYWACSVRSVSPGKCILLCKWLPAVPEDYHYLSLSGTMDFEIINLCAGKLWFSKPSLLTSQWFNLNSHC